MKDNIKHKLRLMSQFYFFAKNAKNAKSKFYAKNAKFAKNAKSK